MPQMQTNHNLWPLLTTFHHSYCPHIVQWTASSEFVSSSIPSWQILTAHAQPFRGARDLAFCLKVPLDSLLVWASSEGSGETARMRRLAWTFAARIGNKYQIRLTRSTIVLLPSLIAQRCVGRQTQWRPRHKANYFTWLGPSFFICCLAHRISTFGFLLTQCSSAVVRRP